MYLIEFSDGEVRQSKDAPSDNDLKKVKLGELSILHFSEDRFEYLTSEGEWVPVERAEVINEEYVH